MQETTQYSPKCTNKIKTKHTGIHVILTTAQQSGRISPGFPPSDNEGDPSLTFRVAQDDMMGVCRGNRHSEQQPRRSVPRMFACACRRWDKSPCRIVRLKHPNANQCLEWKCIIRHDSVIQLLHQFGAVNGAEDREKILLFGCSGHGKTLPFFFVFDVPD